MLKPIEQPLFEHDGSYEIEEIDFDEEIVLETAREMAPADPRLQGLSAETRQIINSMFGGDMCEAVHAASLHCNMFQHPQEWAVEINGSAKLGWKDPSRVRC